MLYYVVFVLITFCCLMNETVTCFGITLISNKFVITTNIKIDKKLQNAFKHQALCFLRKLYFIISNILAISIFLNIGNLLLINILRKRIVVILIKVQNAIKKL